MTTSSIRAVTALLGALTLAGCTAGPDYKGPPALAQAALGAPQFHRAAAAATIPAPPRTRWWSALGDPSLDRLIEAALTRSPDVKAAEARLRHSRAVVRERRADLLPSLRADAANLYADGLEAATGGDGPLRLYYAGFDASWEVDLFGGLRRGEEAAVANSQVAQADLEDLHVSLSAEIADAYIALRDQQQRKQIVEAGVAVERRLVELAAERQARGVASDLDLTRLWTQLRTTEASLIPLRMQIELSLDRLAVLTGRAPGELDTELGEAAALPNIPADVAVGEPAELLRRRPDIRAAERRLTAQNAIIGERAADLFPKLNLVGLLGWGASDLQHLEPSRLALPLLQWNIADFGRARARVGQAEAARDEAAARYQGVVLSALLDAEDSLSRFGHARKNVVALAQVRDSAARAAALMRQRHDAGVATVIDVLDTERARLLAERDLASARAQLVQAYVALQKSLGLGWSA